MQINELPASSALNATDVFAKDTSGTTTEKINAQNLVAGLKTLGNIPSTPMQNPDTNVEDHSSGNLNDAPPGFSAWYGDCVNAPFTFWASILTIAIYTGYSQQIAFPWSNGENRIAYRVKDGGTWYQWQYISMS